MKKLLVIAFIVFVNVVLSQAPSKFYTKFGGPGIDIGYGVKQTSDKGYIVIGSTTSFGAGASDAYLVKVDSMGWTTWMKTFGGFGNDIGRSVLQLSDSGYVFTGFTNSFGNGGYDVYLVRTDKGGNLLWQKTFGGTDWDFGYDIVEASDGALVICGSTTSFGYGGKDGLIIKYDINGNLLWSKNYGGSGDDELRAIIKTNDNAIAAIGGTNSFGEPNGDFYFLKINLSGDTLAQRSFGGPGIDYGTDLIQKYYNSYIIAGAKTYTNNINTQSVSFKYTTNFQIAEEVSFYASSGDERWVAISDTYAGNDQTAFLRNVPVPSYKMQGNIFVANDGALWPDIVNSFGGFNDEEMFGMDRTRDGGYVSIGTTSSFSANNGDVFLIKQDSTITSYQSIIGVKEIKYTKPVLSSLGDKKFRIDSEAGTIKSYRLINQQGICLVDKNVSEVATVSIDLEMFPTGIYILLVEGKNERAVLKLVNQ